MRASLGGIVLAWALFTLAGCVVHEPETPRLADLAFEGVTVVDAISGARPNQRVMIRGDRIVQVGPADGAAPSARRTIDGRGRFLIPGLWDAHVHFLYDPELTHAMAAAFLAYGITSVRDTGGDAETLASMRREWQASGRRAPRLFFSGPLLDGERVVYDGATAEQPPLGTSIPNVEAARREVAWLESIGADFIKIYELVSPEVFDTLVTEARRRSLPIASHVPLSMTADVAGPAVDSMEHLRNIELACAKDWQALHSARTRRMADYGEGRGYPLRKELHESQRLAAIARYDPARCAAVLATLTETMQVPTLRLNAFNHALPFRDEAWQAAVRGLPPTVRERWREKVEERKRDGSLEDERFAEWSLFLVGQMQALGVPIGAGTDTPIGLAPPGESLHRELELLVEAGLTPREALEAATLAPARFFSLDGEMGRVEVGMRADLVLLSADPLVEIRNTRRIEGVVSQGRWTESPSGP